MTFSLILATDRKNGLGKNGELAWKLSEDMKYFKEVTTNTNNNILTVNAVIMGKTTWESIPAKFRPLPGRLNIVLTRDKKYKAEGAITKNSIESALNYTLNDIAINKTFIIGGSTIYNQVLDNPNLEYIYMTKILKDYKCDVFFKGIPKYFKKINDSKILISKKNKIKYSFRLYKNNRYKKRR